MDPIERLLSVEDYQEFLIILKEYGNVDKEALKKEWKERRKPKPAPAPKVTTTARPAVTNRTMASTTATKKVITETEVVTSEDVETTSEEE